MNSERWRRVNEVFSQASSLEAAARLAYLDDACRGDSALRGEVESLLAAHGVPDGVLDRAASEHLPADAFEPLVDRRIGARIGAYELVAHIGRGGMGDVYRARRVDAHYDKDVAIKLVRTGFDTAVVLNRFRVERQILANLEHPGIARLLDGGATEDGLPYLVMELVDGEPIDRYCEQHRLPIRERLRLFREACAAVSYAHQHLVVHRDLKPSNILVSAQGVVKLLDFGIAKLVQATPAEAPSQATQTVFTALTPAFSSPEQLRGAPVTTTSDVYSLGVVLFHLLTGRSPYRSQVSTTEDAIRLVCETDVLRPSAAVAAVAAGEAPRSVPTRELDDITLTALRKEPDRRYQSVEQLSADVDRYLTGQPVAAHGDQWSYRAGKFVKRHAIELAAAVLLALTLIGGVVVTTHEARTAERAQARAERDFNLVRNLANSLIFEIHDSISELPGATAARKILVERALEYLDSLAREATGDATLKRDLAAAFQRIGDVQGKPFATNLGDTAGALRSYQAALALRESVYRASPGNSADGVALALALRLHADALSVTGNIQGAGQEARRAVATTEPIARAHPGDTGVLEELCLDYADLAGILAGNFNSANLNELPPALTARERQLATAKQLVALDPASTRFESLELLAEFGTGDLLLVAGQVREASNFYGGALAKLVERSKDPGNQTNLERLHGAYTRQSFVQLWSRDPRGALLSDRAAFELATKLSVADPKDAYVRLDLASDYANLADALSQLGESHQAQVDAQKAVEMLGAMVAADPTNGEYRVTEGLALYIAGEVARRRSDRADALRKLRAALAIFEKVLDEDPKNADARLHVASTEVKLADEMAAAGEYVAAAVAYRAALLHAGADQPAAPSDEARYATAGADAGLGALESGLANRKGIADAVRRGHLSAACAWYARSDAAWSGIREPGALSPNGFYTDTTVRLRSGHPRCRSSTPIGIAAPAEQAPAGR